jgi:signal peptidase I
MDEPLSTEALSTRRAKPTWLQVRDYLQVLGLTLVVALFLKSCVIEAYRIPSGSMENTLRVGDFLLANKFIYGAKTPASVPFSSFPIPRFRFPALTTPQHGDVVVFELPEYAYEVNTGGTTNYVKRCIGIPGDTIIISNRRVFVNNREMDLPTSGKPAKQRIYPLGFGDSRIFPKGSAFNEDNYGPLVVPRRGDTLHLSPATFFYCRDIIGHEGHTIRIDGNNQVLVDNVPQDLFVVGHDYYFMMGDNRTNSLDSRFWGFVPDDCITAKVMLIYWSIDESKSSFLANIRWERIGTIVR